MYDSLSDLEDDLDLLEPPQRDAFLLEHQKIILHLHRKKEESAVLSSPDGDMELVDSGTVACCASPDIVIDENVHDEICKNCGVASHLATLTVGRVLHLESLKDGIVSTKMSYKRITHFKRYLRDIQAAYVFLPQPLIDHMKIHIPFPSERFVRKYLKGRKLMKYYNQAKYISKLMGSGTSFPLLSSEEYYALLRGFARKSEAFSRYKAQGRTKRRNFISYNLALSLLARENGVVKLLPFIPRLKSGKTYDRQFALWNELELHC